MKLIYKIIIGIVLTGILCAGFWIIDSFFGNPVSAALAKNAARKYLAQNYPQSDYEAADAVYNFKFDAYGVSVSSKSSKDSYFRVSVSKWGKVLSDSYDEVSSGRNTYERLNSSYKQLADSVFSLPEFDRKTSYASGILLSSDELDGGLQTELLELDRDYDVKAFAKTCGCLYILVHDEDRSAENAAAILLQIKELFDKNELPFYAIEFSLCRPFIDSEAKSDENRIDLYRFLYADIYPEGLADRVRLADS